MFLCRKGNFSSSISYDQIPIIPVEYRYATFLANIILGSVGIILNLYAFIIILREKTMRSVVFLGMANFALAGILSCLSFAVADAVTYFATVHGLFENPIIVMTTCGVAVPLGFSAYMVGMATLTIICIDRYRVIVLSRKWKKWQIFTAFIIVWLFGLTLSFTRSLIRFNSRSMVKACDLWTSNYADSNLNLYIIIVPLVTQFLIMIYYYSKIVIKLKKGNSNKILDSSQNNSESISRVEGLRWKRRRIVLKAVMFLTWVQFIISAVWLICFLVVVLAYQFVGNRLLGLFSLLNHSLLICMGSYCAMVYIHYLNKFRRPINRIFPCCVNVRNEEEFNLTEGQTQNPYSIVPGNNHSTGPDTKAENKDN